MSSKREANSCGENSALPVDVVDLPGDGSDDDTQTANGRGGQAMTMNTRENSASRNDEGLALATTTRSTDPSDIFVEMGQNMAMANQGGGKLMPGYLLQKCENVKVETNHITHKHYGEKKPELSPFSKAIEFTKRRLEKFDLRQFCVTDAAKSADSCFQHGICLLEGPEKTGKTSIAQYLMKKNMGMESIQLILRQPDDLQNLLLEFIGDQNTKTTENTIIALIEDVFKTDIWQTNMRELLELVSDGNVHLILTTTTKDLKNAASKSEFKELLNVRYRVSMSSHPLHDHERYAILKMKLQNRQLKLGIRNSELTSGEKEEMLQDIAKVTDYSWFLEFLDCCKSQIQNSSNVVDLFRAPFEFLCGKIRDLDNLKFLTLVVILKHDRLEMRPSMSPESPASPGGIDIQKIAGILGIPIYKATTLNLIAAAREMKEEYVLEVNKHFILADNRITDSISHVVLERIPDVMKWLPLSFLVHHTTLDPDLDREGLKARFLDENIVDVLEHDGFRDSDFVDEFFSELGNHDPDYKEIMLKAISLGQLALVEKITIHILRTLPESGKSIKYLALEKACEVGNPHAYNVLRRFDVEPNLACMHACFRGRCSGIVRDMTEYFSSQFCQLSTDLVMRWMDLVVEVGTLDMLKELLQKVQGRSDICNLATSLFETTVRFGDEEKYHLVLAERDRDIIAWERIITISAQMGWTRILEDALDQIDEAGVDTCNLFLTACRTNQKQTVEYLVGRYPNLKSLTSELNESPLHYAASIGHQERPLTLTYLLSISNEMKPDQQETTHGRSALHRASYSGNIDSVDMLVKAGFNPRVTDKDGNTSLHSHFNGDFINEPTVQRLLRPADFRRKRGSSEGQDKVDCSDVLDLQNRNGDTPLHLLCENGKRVHLTILNTLVQNGPRAVRIRNDKGQTPLHVLLEASCSPQAVELLLDCENLDMAIKDRNNNSILHLASMSINTIVIEKVLLKLKRGDLLSRMLEEPNAEGKTPLHCYVSSKKQKGRKEIVGKLVKRKEGNINIEGNINASDRSGKSPLHLAMYVPDNNEVVEELITLGADIKIRDSQGRTPLHVLCGQSVSTANTLQTLLKNDIGLNLKDTKGMTPLHLACLSGGIDSPQVAKTLLLRGGNVLEEDCTGSTPLHCCCSVSNLQSPAVLQVLLRHLEERGRCDEGLSSRDRHGDTPLHKVCVSQGEEMATVAEFLINKGADVSLENNSGDTVLDISRRNRIHSVTELIVQTTLAAACKDPTRNEYVKRILACTTGPCEAQLTRLFQSAVQIDGPNTVGVLEQLVIKGADVKSRKEGGLTAIHLVGSQQGKFTDDIIGYLITKGVDVTAKDDDGESVLHKVSSGKSEYNAPLIKSLITSRGLAVNDVDNFGENPLHKLLDRDKLGKYYKACMEELISKTCAVDVHNKLQKTPCHLAKKHGKVVLSELFEAYCTKQRVLHTKSLNVFRECGTDVNHQDAEGNTVLHRVCMRRVTRVYNNVKLLLDYGCDKTLFNKEGRTAFDLACDTGLDEDVRELTLVDELDDLENDGPSRSGLSTPTRPLPCPEWFSRSSSTESWEGDLRRGMAGIRNAAGMSFFDETMDNFERQERRKLKDLFKRHM